MNEPPSLASSANLSTDASVDHSRPLPITLFCLVAFIIFGLALYPYFTIVLPLMGEAYGQGMAVYGGVNIVLTIVSVVAYWRMARWGVWLYAALFVIGTVLGFSYNIPWSLPGIAGPIVVLSIGFAYYKRMRWIL